MVNPLVVRAVADLCAHVGGKGLLEGIPGCAAAKDLELAAMCIIRQLKGRRSLDLGDEVRLCDSLHAPHSSLSHFSVCVCVCVCVCVYTHNTHT